jgi:hypothetical protein
MRVQPRLDRLAVHEIHPQAGAAIPHVGAMDRDNVRMAHLRERTSLAEQLIEGSGRRAAAEQLQRHIDIELRIVRDVNLAVRAARDAPAHLQVAPGRGNLRGVALALAIAEQLVLIERQSAVKFGDARDQAQVTVASSLRARRDRRLEGGPVHIGAVSQRLEHRLVLVALRHHRTAPSAARAHG